MTSYSIEDCFSLDVDLERTRGVEFYASEIHNQHTEKIEWKGVKKINNVEYIQDHTTASTTAPSEVRVWQSWRVGVGKVYRWADFEQTVQKINLLNVLKMMNVPTPWVDDSYEKNGNMIIPFS